MLFLSLQIVLVGAVILGLYALRNPLGIAMVFVFVATNQFVQNLLATTVYVEVLGRYPVSPGSAVLFSATLFALLLIYIKEDIPTTRGLVYGVLLANLSLAVVALTTRWGVETGRLVELGVISDWLLLYEIDSFILGTVLLVFDAFLLIILYEALRAWARWMPEWTRILFTLCLVLLLDTVVFVLVVFRDSPELASIFTGNLIGKGLGGILYGTLLWGYVKWTATDSDSGPNAEIRDPLSIITFGERYKALEQEVGRLEQAGERDRQRAEIALRGARLGVWDWLVQTGEMFYDNLWAENLGYEPGSVGNRIESWRELIHPDDRDRVARAIDAQLSGETPLFEAELRMRARSGEWRWVQCLGKAVTWDRAGRPTRMTGTQLDIQKRKGAELELEESRSLLLEAEAVAKLGHWELAIDSNVARWSPGMFEIYGEDPERGAPDFEAFLGLVHPQDRDMLEVTWAEHLRGRHSSESDFRIVRRDGEIRNLHTIALTVFDANGNPVRVHGTTQDVTERKAAEAEVAELEHRYRSLFENMTAGFVLFEVVVDEQGVPIDLEIRAANREFETTTGLKVSEVLGKRLTRVLPGIENDDTDWIGTTGNVALSGGARRFEGESALLGRFYAVTAYQAAPNQCAVVFSDITEGRAAEAAVRESEKRYRSLFENMAAGFALFEVVVDDQGAPVDLVVLATNERFEEKAGLEGRDVIGRHITEVLPGIEDDGADWIGAFGRTSLTGQSVQFERESELLNKHFVVSAYTPGPNQCAASFTDVTERKMAELSLIKLERRFRELFEEAPLMYVITENRGDLLYLSDCNSTFLDALGYERSEVLDRPLSDFYTSESAQKLLEEAGGYRRALRQGSVRAERQLVTKSGEILETLLAAVPERDPSGGLVGTRAMYVDITARKRAEEALAKSESLLREAQDIARVGHWDLDLTNGDAYWSDVIYQLFGVDPEVVPSLDVFLACLHPDDVAATKRAIDQQLASAEQSEKKYRIVTPHGIVRTLHERVKLDLDSEGRPVRMHGTTQDITDQSRIEEELKRSGEQLRRLAARLEKAREEERRTVARDIHDELGQRLTGIKMDVAWIGKRVDDSKHGLRERATEALQLIDETIDSVRDLSARLRPAALDDLGLRDAVLWLTQDFAGRFGIECEVDFAADHARSLDPGRRVMIFRVLQEAMTNVVRHAEAGRVSVELVEAPDELTLRVDDDGKGFNAEEPWDDDALGLLGMRERAEAFGGTLTVSSDVGRGCSVLLTVPT